MATDKKQTHAIHIYTPAHGPKRVEIEREVIRTYENGDEWPVRGSSRRLMRTFAELKSRPLPGGPVMVSSYDDVFALLLTRCAGEIESDHDAKLEAERVAREAAEAARAAAAGAAKSHLPS